MSVKHILLAATAVIALSTPAMAGTSTKEFVHDAPIANQFEIDSSNIALQKSTSDDVKQFAQQMITDHTAAGNNFKSAATSGGVNTADIPTGLDEKHQKMIDKLNKEDAKDFDDLYIKDQQKAHKEAIKLFKDYSKDGDNASLKTFAGNTLPTLEHHQDMIKPLDKAH